MVSLFRSLLLLFAVLTMLTSCGPHAGTYLYNGPATATFSDFAKVRTECYRSLKSESSHGRVNKYGGSYSSGMTVSCGAFNACLASKGFNKNKNGRFDARSISISCSY